MRFVELLLQFSAKKSVVPTKRWVNRTKGWQVWASSLLAMSPAALHYPSSSAFPSGSILFASSLYPDPEKTSPQLSRT